MQSPRPNAVPKCSNCLRGSGKHCSHSDLILDIQRFKKYGNANRTPEYVSFFRNQSIDSWASSIGLSSDQVLFLKRKCWTGDIGDHLLSSIRFNGIPQALLQDVNKNDPGGPKVTSKMLSSLQDTTRPIQRKAILDGEAEGKEARMKKVVETTDDERAGRSQKRRIESDSE